jgi:hypothetical protein
MEEIEKNFFVISELHYRNIFSVVIEKWMFGGGSGSFVKTGFTVRLLRRLSIISEYVQLIPKNSEGEVLFVLGCLH